MSCGHGCGPWSHWPPPDWYGRPTRERDWYEDEEDAPRGRRRRRDRTSEPELAAASLEARLDELHEELQRVETALRELSRPGTETSTPG